MNIQLITFGVIDATQEVIQDSLFGYDSVKDASEVGNEAILNGEAEGYFVVVHYYDESIEDDVAMVVYEENTAGFLLQRYPFMTVHQVPGTVPVTAK